MQTSKATSAPAATHTVKVGSKEDPHQYSPHNITAVVGDVIEFQFYPRNHSVVKADFGAPCVPAEGDIFYSGIFNNFNEQNGQMVGPSPKWYLVVNNTEPTFFYCTALDSCIQNGMVGVINPNATMTWESQYKRAKEYPYMLVPGQSIPAEGHHPSGSGTSSTAHPTSSADIGQGNGSGAHLSPGAIAGIVIGAVAFITILVALFFALGRNRVYQQWMSSQDGRTERTAWWLFHGGAKSDMASSTAHTADQATFVSSPHGGQRAFSPTPQNAQHWSWDSPSHVQPVIPQMRTPTELEANDLLRRGAGSGWPK